MKRDDRVIVGVAVGLVVILVVVFFALFKHETVEIELEPGAAAQANRFLAAERLLNALGLETESIRGPLRLPPPTYVMVLATARRTLGDNRARWLLDWVQQGGHLIVTPRGTTSSEELGESGGPEEPDSPVAPAEAPRDPLFEALHLVLDHNGETGAAALRLQAALGAPPYTVSVARSPRLLWGDPEPSFADADGCLARYQHGAGWVTVLTDGSFLHNDQIGQHEHASFLWSLVTTPHRPERIWLIYRDQLPGLRQILTDRAWTIFVSGVVLLAAWLWLRVLRFGPLLAPPPAGRRSLREHLEATAQFFWRRGQSEALATGVRQAVLHEARRKNPAWSTLSETARLAHLAEVSGVTRPALAEAFQDSPGHDPERFTAMISTLEDVRKSL